MLGGRGHNQHSSNYERQYTFVIRSSFYKKLSYRWQIERQQRTQTNNYAAKLT